MESDSLKGFLVLDVMKPFYINTKNKLLKYYQFLVFNPSY